MLIVDDCIWPWRGRRWCHLVSDESLQELHVFAEWLGLPRRAFQGDHYDLDELLRAHAISVGATAVSARELSRRLRLAGLRLTQEARREFAQRSNRPLAVRRIEPDEPGIAELISAWTGGDLAGLGQLGHRQRLATVEDGNRIAIRITDDEAATDILTLLGPASEHFRAEIEAIFDHGTAPTDGAN